MASHLKKREVVADLLRTKIALKNNCEVVGMTLKKALAAGKGTDRISESGAANKKAD